MIPFTPEESLNSDGHNSPWVCCGYLIVSTRFRFTSLPLGIFSILPSATSQTKYRYLESTSHCSDSVSDFAKMPFGRSKKLKVRADNSIFIVNFLAVCGLPSIACMKNSIAVYSMSIIAAFNPWCCNYILTDFVHQGFLFSSAAPTFIKQAFCNLLWCLQLSSIFLPFTLHVHALSWRFHLSTLIFAFCQSIHGGICCHQSQHWHWIKCRLLPLPCWVSKPQKGIMRWYWTCVRSSLLRGVKLMDHRIESLISVISIHSLGYTHSSCCCYHH